MSDATRELERLAEADGATFLRSTTGAWYARDKDGITVVFGALSRAEAARAYCEANDLVESTPEAILEYIQAQYRPYDSMPEFQEGFEAYQKHGLHRLDRYSDGVKAQAWDRGANTAMLYQRAMDQLDKHKEDIEKAGPGWLANMIHGRRR
jgi:hypothetical protein